MFVTIKEMIMNILDSEGSRNKELKSFENLEARKQIDMKREEEFIFNNKERNIPEIKGLN